MKLLAFAVLITTLMTTSAHSASCEALENFTKTGTPPVISGQTEICSSSKQLGGANSIDCYWTFDYRSAKALQTFDALKQALQQCSQAEVEKDKSRVNHPDSFDQVTVKLSDSLISLSLKDKASLNQTLVFLRATQP